MENSKESRRRDLIRKTLYNQLKKFEDGYMSYRQFSFANLEFKFSISLTVMGRAVTFMARTLPLMKENDEKLFETLEGEELEEAKFFLGEELLEAEKAFESSVLIKNLLTNDNGDKEKENLVVVDKENLVIENKENLVIEESENSVNERKENLVMEESENSVNVQKENSLKERKNKKMKLIESYWMSSNVESVI